VVRPAVERVPARQGLGGPAVPPPRRGEEEEDTNNDTNNNNISGPILGPSRVRSVRDPAPHESG